MAKFIFGVLAGVITVVLFVEVYAFVDGAIVQLADALE